MPASINPTPAMAPWLLRPEQADEDVMRTFARGFGAAAVNMHATAAASNDTMA